MLETNQKGQALVELLISLLICIPFVFGLFVVLQSSWDRYLCVQKSFDEARTELNRFDYEGQTQSELVYTKQCGRISEQVILPLLESRSWQ